MSTELEKTRDTKHQDDSYNAGLGHILDSRGSRTYQIGVLLGLTVGAVLTLLGVVLCVVGITGSIEWIVNGKGWGSKLANASPGVFFAVMGFLILVWYKPKYQFSFSARTQKISPGRAKSEVGANNKIQVSGKMSALPKQDDRPTE